MESRTAERLLLGGLMLAMAALTLLPPLRLLMEVAAPGGALDVALIGRVFARPQTWTAIVNTTEVGLGGTALALVLGGGLGLLTGLTDLPGKPALVFGFLLPMIIPPQVTALAWIALTGPGSPILGPLGLAPPPGTPHPLYGGGGIVLLLGIELAPVVFLAVRAALRAVPRDLIEAARACGASPARALATVVLPLLLPALSAGGALAFVSAIGNFGTPALLGIPGRFPTLPILIYQRLSGFGPRALAEVALLSVPLAVLVVGGLMVQRWLIGGRDYRVAASHAATLSLGRWRPVAAAAAWALIAGTVLAPLLALLATSLVPSVGVALSAASVTLGNYGFVLAGYDAAARAFRNSFGLATAAALLLLAAAVPLGLFLEWRREQRVQRLLRLLAAGAELPYALPGVVLAIACILVFLKPLPLVGISLYGTPWIILVAYLARFLALALRPVVAGFQQLDRALEEAGQMAGAGFGRRLVTLVLPLVGPAAAAGALLVFLTAFNELTVSALLWSSGVETLGVVVFSLDQGGNATGAAALAMLTVVATVGLMALAQLGARRLPRGSLPWQG